MKMDSNPKETFPEDEPFLTEEETREEMRKTCLMSDIVMNYAFSGNTELTQFVLRILLERNDIHVVNVRTQERISPIDFDSHFVVLDIHAIDKDGTHYDIEMQRIHASDLPQRGMIYGGHLLSRYFRKGRKDYRKMPKVYVIFLIDDCKFPEGKLYERYSMTREDTHEEMDRSPEVYLFNMKYKGEKREFVTLFSDLVENEDKKIRYGEVRKTMVQYHQINGGMNDMINHPLENATRRGMEYGMKKGEMKANEQCCLSLLRDGLYPEEKIAELLQMPLSRVRELKKTI